MQDADHLSMHVSSIAKIVNALPKKEKRREKKEKRTPHGASNSNEQSMKSNAEHMSLTLSAYPPLCLAHQDFWRPAPHGVLITAI